MPFTFIKKSTLPVATKGKAATNPRITISDKGQMTLNPLAVKFLNGNGKVGLGFDAASKTVAFFRSDSPTVKKMGDTSELLEFKGPKAKNGKKSKGNVMSLSFGTVLQGGFGDHRYNYKDSGSQTFDMTMDEKNGFISFVLPNGTLPKRPTTPRKPRAKKGKGVNGGVAGNVAPIASGQETPELVLE